MEIAIAMAIFFVFITAAYVAITLFLPEWVGITGKKAKEIMKEQEDSSAADAPAAPPEVPSPKSTDHRQ